MTKPYFRYWGKSSTKDSVGNQLPRPNYHLLAFHSLDVAAVGYELLSPNGPYNRYLSKLLNVDSVWLQAWFTFCLMPHDLGKFLAGFQQQCPNLSNELIQESKSYPYDLKHDKLGYVLLLNQKAAIEAQLPRPEKRPLHIERWLKITTGHHGRPVDGQYNINHELIKHGTEDNVQHAVEFVSDCIALFNFDRMEFPDVKENAIKKASWLLAGISVVADWLGSDPNNFSYKNFENLSADQINLDYYWLNIAKPAAKKAVSTTAFKPKKKTVFKSIDQQFDYIQTPTPLQAKAAEVTLTNSPQLFILEDVTGAGKTEAAMILAHKLMSSDQADGIYVGLPTMATANSMYQRLAETYRTLFDPSELPSLVLAHGASKQHSGFTDAVMLSEQEEDANYHRDEVSASNYCNAWFADSRKKALLAEIGVGTIDQAMLGMLPVRHQALRLLGLYGKVLIIDEVHAYDAYMTGILKSLIEYHASTGGSTILLSATLPNNQRQDYLQAFSKGIFTDKNRHQRKQIQTQAQLDSFPWFTQVGLEHRQDNQVVPLFKESKVGTRTSVARTVRVELIHNESAALELLSRTVENEQCVCWIRNTVALAQKTYDDLIKDPKFKDAEITLFHSRYALSDRSAIENKVLEKFNKDSTHQTRKKQILIATQVVEQSLDIDFDGMITDLAPIDLIIQRAGRLQRHVRDQLGNTSDSEQRSAPTLSVLSPELNAATHQNWLEQLLPSNSYVYDNIGQQWLTAKLLSDKGQFTMPDDARLLIESVYGEDHEPFPKPLENATFDSEGKDLSKASMAKNAVINLAGGYSVALSNKWSEDIDLSTRLAEQETVEVALATLEDNRLIPYANSKDFAWALSIVKVPRKQWLQAQGTLGVNIQSTVDELKQSIKALKWVEVWLIDKHYSAEKGWLSEI